MAGLPSHSGDARPLPTSHPPTCTRVTTRPDTAPAASVINGSEVSSWLRVLCTGAGVHARRAISPQQRECSWQALCPATGPLQPVSALGRRLRRPIGVRRPRRPPLGTTATELRHGGRLRRGSLPARAPHSGPRLVAEPRLRSAPTAPLARRNRHQHQGLVVRRRCPRKESRWMSGVHRAKPRGTVALTVLSARHHAPPQPRHHLFTTISAPHWPMMM